MITGAPVWGIYIFQEGDLCSLIKWNIIRLALNS